MADSICAIVSQLLPPTADGNGRCAAYEIRLRFEPRRVGNE
jgi:Tfp pilus assembly pilus retraction ATPase PilT